MNENNQMIFTEEDIRCAREEERRENVMNLIISTFITTGLVYIALMIGFYL